MNGQKLLNQIGKSTDLRALAKKVNEKNWVSSVFKSIENTSAYCKEMDKLQHEQYLIKIKPLEIIVDDVNKQLIKEDYSLEERESLYLKLFEAQQKIQEASKTETSWKKVAVGISGGILMGSFIMLLFIVAKNKTTGM